MSFVEGAFSVFGLVVLFRALPWPAEWLARKPLSCHVCMSVWMSLGFMVALTWGTGTTYTFEPFTWAGGALALLNVLDLVRVATDVRGLSSRPFEAGDLIEPPKE